MYDRDRTVAIVCGASDWPRMEGFSAAQAFRNTAAGLRDYLADENGLRLSADNILYLFDSDLSAVAHFDEMRAFLLKHMKRMGSSRGEGILVLVAYIGHGAFFERERFYCLLLRDTHEPVPVETSLRVTALSRTLKTTAPRSRRIVILDSCFSGHAVNDFQAELEQIASAKAQEAVDEETALTPGGQPPWGRQGGQPPWGPQEGGVALLCAASSKDPAKLAGRDSFTLFGRALLDVLDTGDAEQVGPLSLRHIRDLIRKQLLPIPDAPKPEIHSPEQSGPDVADEPLFPNFAKGPLPPLEIENPGYRKKLHTAKVAAVTVLTVLAAAVGVAAIWAGIEHDAEWRRAHCGTEISTLLTVGDECIGLSDGSFDLFQPRDGDPAVQDRIAQVQNTIKSQNDTAARRHHEHPERPYITLVHLEALTAPEGGTAASSAAERESLEGLAVAQQAQLEADGARAPIVRVLIGNAGREMKSGPQVAAMVIEAAAADHTIVGVVGLNLSNQATKTMVAQFNDAGIPTVATTLSFDYLADWVPLFMQVAPQNRSEAATAAGFAAQLAAPKTARIYYSGDPEDLYSTNLRNDAIQWFRSFDFTVQATAFTPAGQRTEAQRPEPGDRLVGNAAAAGADNCGDSGIAFFAARGVPDFGAFLDGVATCHTSSTIIIGDDDVTRHVADPAARRRNPDVPYYFISFAPAPLTDAEPGAAPAFYSRLEKLFSFEQAPGNERSLDGHAALAYDAAQVYITAVGQLAPGAVGLQAVADRLPRIGTVQGVTGTFNYSIGRHPNVPKHKPVTVLRVENGNVVPEIQAYCGQFPGRAQPPAPWCPADADENPPTPPR